MTSSPERMDQRGIAGFTAVLVLLGVSAVALAVAPAVLDESYSWVEHTTSQAGGQGVDGAWMARLGFLLFGLAVIWLTHRKAGAWRQPATASHVAFGVAAACWWPGRRANFRVLDVVAIAASVVIPLTMAAATEYTGALQRAMFAVAYLWYAREAIDALRCTEPQVAARREVPTDP